MFVWKTATNAFRLLKWISVKTLDSKVFPLKIFFSLSSAISHWFYNQSIDYAICFWIPQFNSGFRNLTVVSAFVSGARFWCWFPLLSLGELNVSYDSNEILCLTESTANSFNSINNMCYQCYFSLRAYCFRSDHNDN